MSNNQRFVKGRIITHFEDRSLEEHGSGWSNLWDAGDSTLWDRGKPSPALVDIVEEHYRPGDLLHPLISDGRRKRVLVPGCGRGYDVVMLALHGFDAVGLDISATGVAEAEKYASTEIKAPGADNFGPFSGDSTNEHGTVQFVQGDFFTSDWVDRCGGSFDLIYDYTFLCALHPSMHQNWATRMAELLQPGGLLVCLEFPMYKDFTLPGPPWGLNGVHLDLLARGGNGLMEDQEDKSEGRFGRVLYVKPSRTYEVGSGTDMLSIYRRKD